MIRIGTTPLPSRRRRPPERCRSEVVKRARDENECVHGGERARDKQTRLPFRRARALSSDQWLSRSFLLSCANAGSSMSLAR